MTVGAQDKRRREQRNDGTELQCSHCFRFSSEIWTKFTHVWSRTAVTTVPWSTGDNRQRTFLLGISQRVMTEADAAGISLSMLPAFAALMDRFVAEGEGHADWTVVAKDFVVGTK